MFSRVLAGLAVLAVQGYAAILNVTFVVGNYTLESYNGNSFTSVVFLADGSYTALQPVRCIRFPCYDIVQKGVFSATRDTKNSNSKFIQIFFKPETFETGFSYNAYLSNSRRIKSMGPVLTFPNAPIETFNYVYQPFSTCASVETLASCVAGRGQICTRKNVCIYGTPDDALLQQRAQYSEGCIVGGQNDYPCSQDLVCSELRLTQVDSVGLYGVCLSARNQNCSAERQCGDNLYCGPNGTCIVDNRRCNGFVPGKKCPNGSICNTNTGNCNLIPTRTLARNADCSAVETSAGRIRCPSGQTCCSIGCGIRPVDLEGNPLPCPARTPYCTTTSNGNCPLAP